MRRYSAVNNTKFALFILYSMEKAGGRGLRDLQSLPNAVMAVRSYMVLIRTNWGPGKKELPETTVRR